MNVNGTAAERLDEYLSVENAPFDLSEITQGIPEGTPAEQGFRVETKDQANWALRKIAGIERGRAEAKAAAQLEISRIQEWLADEEKRADQARGYLDFLLEDYHRRQLLENPKAKTIKLPLGDLQLRAQQPEIIKDEKLLLDWADKNRPEFVKQEPTLEWGELKKVLKFENGKAIDPVLGEVVTAITVNERPAKFSIKLSGV